MHGQHCRCCASVLPTLLSLQTFLPLFLCVCVQVGEDVGDITGEGVLRLLLQPWEAREVAVVFTPSEHKPTTTILLIRY